VYPVLVELGGFTLHTYGALVAIAVLVATWIASREASRSGFAPDTVERLALPVVIAGLAGGRLAHVLGWERELLWTDPLAIVAVWRGGLAVHGALLGGLAAGVWHCRRHGLAAWRLGDALAPAIILGQAIGRVGCLFSGDSYGRPSELPWAVTFADPRALAPLGVPLHPVQLYEAALDLVLFGVLWSVGARARFDGQRFLLYLGGYGSIRFVTEVFRGDRLELALGLSLGQVISLVVLVLAAAGYARRASAPQLADRAKAPA
jgi:phosphatidylglycerol---prolipoprotein diacylglyceryl transferase